jgi:uncharacterized paraquat-inducible protein A
MTAKPNNNIDSDKRFIRDQLKWLVVYVGIGFAVSFFLSFPISLVVASSLYALIFFIRARVLKKRRRGANGTRSLFDFLSSSSMLANEIGQLKYYCMCCAIEHREAACPKCGSKMKRVGT